MANPLDQKGYRDLVAQLTKRGESQADAAGARARGRAQQRFGGQATDIGLAAETGARQQALDPSNLNIAQIMAGATEAERGREYGTSERLGRQEYGTGEREAGQRYGTSERLGRQQYGTSERLGGQEFTSGERGKDRAYGTSEREAAQTFGARAEGLTDDSGKWINFGGTGEYGSGRIGADRLGRYDQAAINADAQRRGKSKSKWYNPIVGAASGVGTAWGLNKAFS